MNEQTSQNNTKTRLHGFSWPLHPLQVFVAFYLCVNIVMFFTLVAQAL